MPSQLAREQVQIFVPLDNIGHQIAERFNCLSVTLEMPVTLALLLLFVGFIFRQMVTSFLQQQNAQNAVL